MLVGIIYAGNFCGCVCCNDDNDINHGWSAQILNAFDSFAYNILLFSQWTIVYQSI